MTSAGSAGFPAYRVEEFNEQELLTYEFPPIDETVTIAIGQVLKRGAVLGKVTGTGQHVLSVAAANDGSQNPVAILAFDVDATDEVKSSKAYVAGGRFIASELTYGAGHSATTVKAAFAGKPLFLVSNVI